MPSVLTAPLTATDTLAQANTIATHAAVSIWSSGSDFLVLLVAFGIFFLFAWILGRGPLVALLIALYAAYAVYVFFPFQSLIPNAPATTALFSHVGLYLAFTLAFFLILRRVVVSDFLYIGLIGIVILSFLGAGFALALGFHSFGITSVYQFTPAVTTLFAPQGNFFWWFVAPVIGLFFLAN